MTEHISKSYTNATILKSDPVLRWSQRTACCLWPRRSLSRHVSCKETSTLLMAGQNMVSFLLNITFYKINFLDVAYRPSSKLIGSTSILFSSTLSRYLQANVILSYSPSTNRSQITGYVLIPTRVTKVSMAGWIALFSNTSMHPSSTLLH